MTIFSRNPQTTIASPVCLFHYPGMSGAVRFDRELVRTATQAGLDARLHDWPRYWIPLRNLRNRRQHHQAARTLAEHARAVEEEHPGRRIVLTGHSTGALVLLEALEQLPPELIEQTWLLAAAVSRDYDLNPALQATRRMVNVYSVRDWLQLYLGTLIGGTADGRHAESAGHRPFTGPGSDHPRLEQWAYQRAWTSLGYRGDHFRMMGARFVRKVIVPAITAYEAGRVSV